MPSPIANDGHYVRFEQIDMNGKALSKTVPNRHRDDKVYMYSGALAFGANACLQLPTEVLAAGCPNAEIVPDWSTEQVLPWAGDEAKGIVVHRVYCEQLQPLPATEKNGAGPRFVCRKMVDALAAHGGRGLKILAASELEFALVNASDKSPVFEGIDIFATLQNSKSQAFMFDVERAMSAVGVDIKTMNAEYGRGQLEITFAPTYGIEAGDASATFKTGVKELAQQRGLMATFCSKPFGSGGAGNGGHMNFSLWEPSAEAAGGTTVGGFSTDGVVNALHDSNDPEGLSATARQFLAGVLAHLPALEALCAPTPCCYLRHGAWAPNCANWGREDRMAAVRVKCDPKGPPRSCYFELRAPSASACAYLVIGGLIAAGLDGLERNLELPPEKQSAEAGAVTLPTDLESSLKALEADEYMGKTLGPDLVRWFCQVKRGELEQLATLEKEALAETSDAAEAKTRAWQTMYMEFV